MFYCTQSNLVWTLSYCVNMCSCAELENNDNWFSEYYLKMVVSESDSSLTSQCLDFCQRLASQGQALSFSLKIGTNFSFTLETKETMKNVPPSQARKKLAPSSIRRNARWRQKFLETKEAEQSESKQKTEPTHVSFAPKEVTASLCWPEIKPPLISPGQVTSSTSPVYRPGTEFDHGTDSCPGNVPPPPSCSKCENLMEWYCSRVKQDTSWLNR